MDELLTQIHQPRSWNDIIKIVDNQGDVEMFFGVWNKIPKALGSLNLPSQLISTEYMEECKRISRSERFIDGGSGVSIQEFINTGKKILPQSLVNILRNEFPHPLRNSLLLGYLIEGEKVPPSITLLLALLDCSIEMKIFKTGKKKTQIKHQWVNIQKKMLGTEGAKQFINTIRIPLFNWEHFLIRRINYTHGVLHVIVLADMSRGYISDFRMGFIYNRNNPIRNKEWEANILGRKTFFSKKERENIYQYLLGKGIPEDEEYLKPSLMMILENLLYHFQDREY